MVENFLPKKARKKEMGHKKYLVSVVGSLFTMQLVRNIDVPFLRKSEADEENISSPFFSYSFDYWFSCMASFKL